MMATTLATNARLATRPAATVESKAGLASYVARRADFMPPSQLTSTTYSYVRRIEGPTTWSRSRPRSMAPGSATLAGFQTVVQTSMPWAPRTWPPLTPSYSKIRPQTTTSSTQPTVTSSSLWAPSQRLCTSRASRATPDYAYTVS